ncbi:MAG: valine--tRNA ligase [Myxococcales bacterium]|nr:valine--tRNA ligase [Myxococcales bacterium]
MTAKAKEPSTISADAVGKHFDAEAAELRWHAFWQEQGSYHWDESLPREQTFVVDTPPPTVSGSLHIGHVFSYTQTDVSVRYKRMRGFGSFYPMGWDDNGLPTERRVQNYYHVRCDPTLPYEAGLELEEATAKQRKGRPRQLSRQNFIELCEQRTRVDEQAYMDLWTRLGLSIDWRQTYATIDVDCRRIAQLSFLDLHQKGHIYQSDAPTMWDVDFQSAVAQAEIEERTVPSAFHKLEFGVQGSDACFVVATTRPELLPACVGVTAHPDDARYKSLFGKNAVTPLFRAPVPIFPSELADPEKGSGIVMVCTFGDQTDVEWWRKQRLPLRQVVTRVGRMAEVRFGSDAFPSLDPAAANGYYAQLAGKTLKQAQTAIVGLLQDATGSATGKGAPLQEPPRKIEHSVKFFEKGDRPLELVPTRQWFVRLTDKKEALLEKGREIEWVPGFMQGRYEDWVENLGLDWCLSRQRFFGVPIPVWYRLGAQGEPLYEDGPLLPEPRQLPVDPMIDTPDGYSEAQRRQPGGFVAEPDIFDTWFTSSMTPQISAHWGRDDGRFSKLFPADVRPQGHDIIRTWAFYTVAKALLHHGQAPWRHTLLSGWILDPDRKKMSKSVGNTVTPMHLLEQYGSDAVRYWAASAKLGVDTAFDDKVFKVGKRLVTKLFNAGKFVLSQQAERAPIRCELDRAFVAKLRQLVDRVSESHEQFNYATALLETESFFWTHFTDSYLELAKTRARSGERIDADEQGSAVAALRLGLDILLRLFAPILPFITEEIWSWVFAAERGQPSIHRAPWPTAADFEGIASPDEPKSFELAVTSQAAINKRKSDASVSVGRPIERLVLATHPETAAALAGVIDDVLAATRTQSHELRNDPAVQPGSVRIIEAHFAEAAAK